MVYILISPTIWSHGGIEIYVTISPPIWSHGEMDITIDFGSIIEGSNPSESTKF